MGDQPSHLPARRGDVYIVDAVAEIGDQFQLVAGLRYESGIDPVGDGRHENVRLAHRGHQLGLRHRLVVDIEPRIEQLPHPGFDRVRKFAGNDDERLFPA